MVELDGGIHEVRLAEDSERDVWLTGQGFVVLRFFNDELAADLDLVVEKIRDVCECRPQWRY